MKRLLLGAVLLLIATSALAVSQLRGEQTGEIVFVKGTITESAAEPDPPRNSGQEETEPPQAEPEEQEPNHETET